MGAKKQKANGKEWKHPPEFPQLCRYLAELSPQPMLAVEGITHVVRYANPAFCRLVGKDSRRLVGRKFSAVVPESMANGCAPLLDRVFQTGVPERLVEQEHCVSTEAVGSEAGPATFPTHLTYLAWAILLPAANSGLGENERPVGVMIQVTDATEIAAFRKASAAVNEALLVFGVRQHELMEALSQSEAQERQACKEAEAANQSKDLFMATLSHELRTPLNAIVGWSAMLSEDGCDKDDWAEGLSVISRSARSQAQLLDEMLDISRIVSGKLKLETAPCRLANIIPDALDIIRPAAAEKEIELVLEMDPAADAPGFYDEVRMQQVVLNLLTNAIKFTPEKGRVTVVLSQDHATSRLQVTDTGAGMSAELLPHVFDRYHQGDSSSRRRYGGLGLGLSIVKHIVEMHGGRVEAHSAGEGAGSTFTVTLPVRGLKFPESAGKPEDLKSADSPQAAAAPLPAVQLAGLRILAVDDDDDARRLLVKVLQDAGATVTPASSTAEAMELLKQTNADVLVSDLGMPGEDGYDLIRKVREAGYTAKKLPAVAVTAFAGEEYEKRAMLAGYQVHVAKPIDQQRLILAIADLAGVTG